MGEHSTTYKTLGYAALISALLVGVINVILSFNISEGLEREVITYGLYGIFASVPMVILAGKSREFMDMGSGKKRIFRRKKESSDVELEPNEFVLVDTRPHKMHFVKSTLALVAITVLFFALSIAYMSYPTMDDDYWWARFLVFTGTLAIMARIPYGSAFPKSSYIAHTARIWTMVFALWWGMSAATLMKIRGEGAYPRAFWEQLLGLPPVAMVMFAIILFIFSGMLWRIDSYVSKNEHGPIGAISIIMLAAGIAAIFPPLWAVFSEQTIHFLFAALVSSTLIYWILLALFSYYKGGVKFLFTTKRIITIKDFLGREVQEHPYDSIISVEILQGMLGERLSYGDLRFIVRRGRIKVGFTVHGIKNPVLVKNTVMALSSRERIRRKKGKARSSKNRPKDREESVRYYGTPPSRIYHLRPY